MIDSLRSVSVTPSAIVRRIDRKLEERNMKLVKLRGRKKDPESVFRDLMNLAPADIENIIWRINLIPEHRSDLFDKLSKEAAHRSVLFAKLSKEAAEAK
jgi:hypothetical protein